MRISWVRYKNYSGAKYLGDRRYCLPSPPTKWDRILGVVARCEGNYDTTISYDGTGLTWGFQQWTFTSGRLQRLLEYFKSIPVYDFTTGKEETLFDSHFCGEDGSQLSRQWGFIIRKGKFYDTERATFLHPAKQKKRIVDICMKSRKQALAIAEHFGRVGSYPEIGAAQVEYAKMELKRSLDAGRPPLKEFGTIRRLLGDKWNTPAPALFFNLWQNNPGAAYKLFMRARRTYVLGRLDIPEFFEHCWRLFNQSKFGNWSYKSKMYTSGKSRSPRIIRVKKAMKEFYGLDLKITK